MAIEINYTDERNTQILITLLKNHNIKRIIVSPGSTNICFVASVQHDPFFELYSSVDERSASYMACGLSAETGEPVALSCTGATASRNYMPGLTEAFYRHLPVLAITSTQPRERVGQNIPQVLDRSVLPKDIVKTSIYVETVYNSEKEWAAISQINQALIELRKEGGGPVHIDLETTYSPNFNVKQLPRVPKVEYYFGVKNIPEIEYSDVAIFVGAHQAWSKELEKLVDNFCELYNGAVLCDHTSNYMGKYKILPNIISIQKSYRSSLLKIKLLIHIGEMSGAYMQIEPENVWRVHPDGLFKDTFKHLRVIVQSEEQDFFKEMVNKAINKKKNISYYTDWEKEYERIYNQIPELPFSNVWVAEQSAKMLPSGSAIHFGILNSLRSWNFFSITEGVFGYCNTGGFGIDGGVSSLIGASLANNEKLYFGVVGDLAFFYDMNSMGNRHVGNNVRLMIINNGKGNEFRNYGCWASKLGSYADEYVCAARHFGNKSNNLVKHFAEDLGYDYLCCSTKHEFNEIKKRFFSFEKYEKPIILEVFTTTEDESKALELIYNICENISSSAKDMAKNILGEDGIRMLKKIMGKQ